MDGIYEFVVINNGKEPISYSLNVAADNVSTSRFEAVAPPTLGLNVKSLFYNVGSQQNMI